MRHKFIEIEGVKVHYVEAGRGNSDLVLIHSWPMSWKVFDRLIPFLDNNYHLIALDLPGFGRSGEMSSAHTSKEYLPLIEALLDKLKISKYFVVGISYGSILAVRLALRKPERVRGLIINGLPYYHKRLASRTTRALARQVVNRKAMGRIFHVYNKSRVKKNSYFLSHQYINKYISAKKLKSYFDEFKQYSNRAARESLAEVLKVDMRDELKRLKQPVLVIAGLQDALIKLKHQGEAVSLMSDGYLVCIDKADHACVVEHPREFANQIRKFVS